MVGVVRKAVGEGGEGGERLVAEGAAGREAEELIVVAVSLAQAEPGTRPGVYPDTGGGERVDRGLEPGADLRIGREVGVVEQAANPVVAEIRPPGRRQRQAPRDRAVIRRPGQHVERERQVVRAPRERPDHVQVRVRERPGGGGI